MHTQDIHLLFDYSNWANARILDTAAALSEAEYAAATFSTGERLHNTLAHILEAEQVWRLRCQHGVSPMEPVAAENIPSLAALRELWESEDAAVCDYLASLSDDRLNQAVSYANSRGQAFENTLWHVFMHVINHGTQHRSEVAMLLTDLGHSPGDIDFMIFLRDHQS